MVEMTLSAEVKEICCAALACGVPRFIMIVCIIMIVNMQYSALCYLCVYT